MQFNIIKPSCIGALIFASPLFLSSAAATPSFIPVPNKGTIKGAQVQYKDSDEVTIEPGYGEANGAFWQITAATDVTVPQAGNDQFVYIYIDDSASIYPAVTLIASTTAPTWSVAGQGWYSGDDRCLAAVYEDSSDNVGTFENFDGFLFYNNYWTLLSGGAPDSTWKTISDSDSATPVNAVEAMLYMQGKDSAGNGVIGMGVGAVEASRSSLGLKGPSDGHEVSMRGRVLLGPSRKLQWHAQDDDDDVVIVRSWGYRISR